MGVADVTIARRISTTSTTPQFDAPSRAERSVALAEVEGNTDTKTVRSDDGSSMVVVEVKNVAR